MPIYEYECEDGHRFELMLSFDKADDQQWCLKQECGYGQVRCGLPAKRRTVPSSPAVSMFKGPGFTRSSNMGKAR